MFDPAPLLAWLRFSSDRACWVAAHDTVTADSVARVGDLRSRRPSPPEDRRRE
jgi:hypothetical protein